MGQLREHGVALCQGALPLDSLALVRNAAAACFAAIETGQPLPGHYRYNRFSHSVLLPALLHFGCDSSLQLLAPLVESGLDPSLSEVVGYDLAPSMEESWVRKKYAPRRAPKAHHPQDWHQDGALGVRFPTEPGVSPPMTRLVTCWLPLNPCGTDSPGLEFIRRRQEALLHFTELNDANLRGRFARGEFWAPNLDFGDVLVFLNGTLHRTHLHPAMEQDRMSIEYRLFPTA